MFLDTDRVRCQCLGITPEEALHPHLIIELNFARLKQIFDQLYIVVVLVQRLLIEVLQRGLLFIAVPGGAPSHNALPCVKQLPCVRDLRLGATGTPQLTLDCTRLPVTLLHSPVVEIALVIILTILL